MKKSAVSLSVSMMLVVGSLMALAPQAHAIVMSNTVAQCSGAMDDGSIEIQIVENTVGLFPNPSVTDYATVTESTLNNQLSTNLKVRESQSSLLGAPRVYSGENFKLDIVTDAAPSEQGILAYLTMNLGGIEVSQMQLRCTLNQMN